MRRELFVGRQNRLKDKLETSTDNGVTWTGVDLTAATEVILQVYDDPASPILELKAKTTHSSQFSLGATGIVEWTPTTTTITAAMIGNHNVRYIVQTSDPAAGGEVFEAPGVVIKE